VPPLNLIGWVLFVRHKEHPMKKFAIAAVVSFTLVGWVMAEEFTLQVTKISDDGSKVTGFKAKGGKGGFGGFGKGEEVTIKLAPGLQVHKGKFDPDAMAFVKEGDDLKIAGLKTALSEVPPAGVTIGGTKLADKDKLELSMKDGKVVAKLNGKDIDLDTVQYTPKAAMITRATTDDNGVVTSVILFPAFGKKGKN
jgi:hypothetical protein